MDTERARRHASKLLTYPLTIGSVLHQNSGLTLSNQRVTPEGSRSLAGESFQRDISANLLICLLQLFGPLCTYLQARLIQKRLELARLRCAYSYSVLVRSPLYRLMSGNSCACYSHRHTFTSSSSVLKFLYRNLQTYHQSHPLRQLQRRRRHHQSRRNPKHPRKKSPSIFLTFISLRPRHQLLASSAPVRRLKSTVSRLTQYHTLHS